MRKINSIVGKVGIMAAVVAVSIILILHMVAMAQVNPSFLGNEAICTEYYIYNPVTGTYVPAPWPSHLITFLYYSNNTGLNQLLYNEYYNPSSPLYHHFISPQQFNEWFSPPSGVYGNLTAIAQAYGMNILLRTANMFVANGTEDEAYDACVAIIYDMIYYYWYNILSDSWVTWVMVAETQPIGFYLALSPSQLKPLIESASSLGNQTGFIKLPVTYNGEPVMLKYYVVRFGDKASTGTQGLALYLGRQFSVNLNLASVKPIGQYQEEPMLIGNRPVAVSVKAQSVEVKLSPSGPSQIISPSPMIEIYLPQAMELFYNATALYPYWFIGNYNGYNGSTVRMGIVDAFGDVNFAEASYLIYDDIIVQDADLFSEIFGLPLPTIDVVYPMGMPVLTPFNVGDAEGWSYESVLDVEWAHAIAPGATIVFGVSPDAGDDLFATVEYLVNQSLVNFISLSWGLPEDFMDPWYAMAYDEIFMQAAAQGIGIFASSGDWGSYEYFPYPYPFVSAFYPSVDPWVTGVGGTSNYMFPALLYARPMRVVGWPILTPSPTRFITAWSFWSFGLPPYYGIYWGTGGGYSIFYAMPLYQYQYVYSIEGGGFYQEPQFQPYFWGFILGQFFVGVPYVPTTGIPWYRSFEISLYPSLYSPVGAAGYPQVAADANPLTGVLIVVNGKLSPYIWGGTSLASPLTMAMVSLWQDYINKNGISYTIGLAAPVLAQLWYMEGGSCSAYYPVGSYGTNTHGAFYPTVYGQNGALANSGWFVKNPCAWNPVTGLGSLDVGNLAYYGTPIVTG